MPLGQANAAHTFSGTPHSAHHFLFKAHGLALATK